ncbi:MAG: hypothetical protein HY314_11975 [Acidobacteria bacterium]|nr:hypothetical protein [Acidobacteriota bacterium]
MGRSGADVNARDPDGGTPLSAAANGGNLDVENVLLKAGADVGAKLVAKVTQRG